MVTKNQNDSNDLMVKKISCIRVDGESFREGTHEVVEEVPVAVFVNGRHAVTALMSPVMLEEFVTGYLFTEQIIKNRDEIESIKIEKNRISVITRNLFKVIGPKKTILSGCGGSTSYIDTEKLPVIESDFSIESSAISSALTVLLDSDIHKQTGGVHVVGLLNRNGLVVQAEDIGRHNALDRVIGHGLRNNVDFSQSYIVCSGRISSEMIRKSLIAGISLAVSRGATTTLAVAIAEKTGICLIGFARSMKMNIYTHPERVRKPRSGSA